MQVGPVAFGTLRLQNEQRPLVVKKIYQSGLHSQGANLNYTTLKTE